MLFFLFELCVVIIFMFGLFFSESCGVMIWGKM